MHIYHNFTQLIDIKQPVHWAAGFFDGVHRGHRRVIASAQTEGALRGVVCFTPHPLAVLKPELAPLLLTPAEEKKQSNALKNFLSPKQQEMYESYQKLLNF